MFKNISYILMWGGVFYFSNKYFSLLSPENLIAIAGIIATVAGILSGFSLAAITMLMGAVGNRVIRALKNNGLFKNLLHDLNINCISLVSVSFVSLLSMIFVSSSINIFVFDSVMKLLSILLSLAMSIMTCLLFSFFSTWRKISNIVSAISKM